MSLVGPAWAVADLRVGNGKLSFDLIGLAGTVHRLMTERPLGWRVLITPNLYHLRLLRHDPQLMEQYQRAEMILPDGWPVAAMLSRTTGTQVERVAGSDLLECLLGTRVQGRPLVLVGGRGHTELEVLSARAANSGWVVHTEPAPAEEVDDPTTRAMLLKRIASSGNTGIVVLGLGAPKQEQFALELAALPGSGYILCLGMAINFSAGAAERAPRWVQRMNLEWAHRMLQEPKRLGPRYASDLRSFLPLFVQNYRGRA